MARIPDDAIERLKVEVSLVRLVESAGVELKRVGKDWHGCCPFHDDKTPSLIVSPEKNLWHCLGACDTGGSVIDWTMKVQGVSFRHAVELLREQPLSLAAESSAPVKRTSVRKLAGESAFAPDADEQRLLVRVVDYYHQTLKQSPVALDYLKSRGLANAELIDTYRLGYADRTLGYRLPEKNRQAGAAIRSRLQSAGILRDSGHEHFNGSLVIPIFDAAGNVVQLYGRKLTPNLRAGTPSHLYLPRPQAGVFNHQNLVGATEVILCEALIDALSFAAAGFRNVTTAYGVNGFTDELLDFLIAQKTRRVLIAYDRDAAGDAAALDLAPRLMAAGIEAFRILFPHGFDANAYAQKVQPAAKSLGVAIRSAQWMGKGSKAPVIESAPQVIVRAPVSVKPTPTAVSPLAAEVDVPPPILPEPTRASPMPEAPAVDVPIEVRPHEILILLGDRRWRVRGLSPEPVPGQLKVNLLVSRGDAFHVDTLDLYAARLRGVFLKQAAAELAFSEDTLKRDLGTVLLKLEAVQAEAADKAAAQVPAMQISNEDKAAALALLRDPALTARIVEDLSACGIVGEDTNKLTAYLACVSRKLESPLAIVIQSLSASGKSALMDAVLELMPEEERVQYSAMTGQSVFYLGEQDLKHKILALAEEEGAREAAYALKLLQSQGVLTIASTGKDAVTGKLVTHTYRVEGPVMLFLTTTAIDLDEELLNRCLVLTVNESREQTRAIHVQQRQAETLDGLLASETKKRVQALHRNAQRLLRPLKVVNPFAPALSFLDDRARTRRDHKKYLSLIRAVTLLHQYQREIKTVEHQGQCLEYLEATAADIALANRLAHRVLGQSLDELPPQTRNLLERLHAVVTEAATAGSMAATDVRFTRREVMRSTRWSYDQVRVHLDRLVSMDYVLAHRGSRGAQFVYELVWRGEGSDGEPFVMGLSEADGKAMTETLGGESGDFGRPVGGASALAGAGVGTPAKSHPTRLSAESATKPEKPARYANGAASHRSDGGSVLAA
jgi:DNA primase catalytic core